MMTQIVHGNPSPISEMQRMLSKISTTFTPPFHLPSPLIQQTSFCYSKSSQSHLLNFTHAAFLSITWKLIFRRGVVLWSHSLGLHFNGLSQFFSFHLILSDHVRLQTVRRFPMGTHLSHTLHFTNTCLPMVNLVLLNLTLFLIVHFHAVHGYAATHTHFPHVHASSSILPLPCGCIMPLISTRLALDYISRFSTNMYIPYDDI